MKNLQILAAHSALEQIIISISSMEIFNPNVIEMKQYGETTRTGVYRGSRYSIPAENYVRIEVVLEDDMAHEAVETIRSLNKANPALSIRILLNAVEDMTAADSINSRAQRPNRSTVLSSCKPVFSSIKNSV